MDFPPAHDIQELLILLEKAAGIIPCEIQNAGMLTPYAVETRYPGYWGNIGENDVQEAFSLAEKVLDWAEKQILVK